MLGLKWDFPVTKNNALDDFDETEEKLRNSIFLFCFRSKINHRNCRLIDFVPWKSEQSVFFHTKCISENYWTRINWNDLTSIQTDSWMQIAKFVLIRCPILIMTLFFHPFQNPLHNQRYSMFSLWKWECNFSVYFQTQQK